MRFLLHLGIGFLWPQLELCTLVLFLFGHVRTYTFRLHVQVSITTTPIPTNLSLLAREVFDPMMVHGFAKPIIKCIDLSILVIQEDHE